MIPCNGMAQKAVMGNLKETDWDTLWTSDQAEKVRECTRKCDRNCWMIGSASPAMHRYIWVPAWWVFVHKFIKRGYSLSENDQEYAIGPESGWFQLDVYKSSI